MENSKPPRFILPSKTLGIMEVSQDVLDGLTISGVSTAGLSAFERNITASVFLLIATVSLQLLKRGLASTISRSIPKDPINTTEHRTVSLPTPLTSPETTDTTDHA